MTRSMPHRPLFIALSLALVGAAGPSLAANATDGSDPRHAEPTEIDRIIVNASPLRQTAEELSRPVEVLNGEALDRAKRGTLGETLDGLPGVQSTDFGPGVGRPILRGLDGPRVGILSGGLSNQDVSSISQDHAVSIEPFLADQIEVLKGPATLLYGSGAIGGVVNVVDGRIAERALEDTVQGRAELRYDSAGKGRGGVARIDAMGANGALVLHADGAYRDQDDYEVPGDAGFDRDEQANSFVRTHAGALGVSYVGADGFVGVSMSRYDTRYGNPGEPGDEEEGGVSLDLLQDRFDFKAGVNREFGPFDGLRLGFANTAYEHTEFEGEEIGTRFISDANEGRLELTHKPFGAWKGAIGLQIGNREFEAIGEEAFVPATRTRSQGLFVVEQAKWDAVQVDLGARIDRVDTDARGGPQRSFTPLSLSAGLVYAPSDAWRFSVSLDRAERAPAEEELFADGPHVATGAYEIGNPRFREERANRFEIGAHFHSDRIDAKLALYQTKFDGFIYLDDTGLSQPPEEPGEDGLPIFQWLQNDATFRGIEGEIKAALVQTDAGRLELRGFGDYVRAELDGGGDLPRIAPARAGLDLAWETDAWRASLGATRVMRQDKVAAFETETAGYTLVDAHFAYHWDTDRLGWEVFVDADNLTDQVARVHTSYLKDRVVLPGRNFSAGVRLFF